MEEILNYCVLACERDIGLLCLGLWKRCWITVSWFVEEIMDYCCWFVEEILDYCVLVNRRDFGLLCLS